MTPERRLHLIPAGETVVLEWTARAACAGCDQDLFFPRKNYGRRGHGPTVLAAKAICATCPVREECLEHALTRPEVEGLWGGLTAWERRDLKRRTG